MPEMGESKMMPPWIVTSEVLHSELSSNSAPLLLDVREPEEFAEGRIPQCVLIPLGELGVRGPQELKTDANIVIYCGHGIRSLQGLQILRSLGFKQLRSLDGGIAAWADCGFKIES